jgi:DNA gyrase inhibitor GyrI
LAGSFAKQEDERMRKDVLAGAAAVGAALIGGAAFYYFKERQTEEPDFRPLESDGDYQIRDYPAMTVAETVVDGPRRDALDQGFRILADYLFAKSRDGEKLEMTVPVMQDSGDPMASDPPLFDDELEGAWRTRFVMPDGRSPDDLPEPPDGVTVVELSPRKVAVVSFSGVADDRLLAKQEDRLRGWLARRGEMTSAEPEYAFYNSPMIPGPLRRNEVWLALG